MNELETTAIPDDFSALSEEWSIAGRKLGKPTSHGCVVGNCRSLSFVDLQTRTGHKAICFRHYTLMTAQLSE
jgi:hypothetical protein